MFLRNHDELTLEMVTDEERDYMYRSYAADQRARINLGIRRRLAPLLGNDRPRIEVMNALLFSMPGTPVMYYGDEIGMGDNVYLGDRNGVRTPMQWNPDRNAGFSSANPQKLYLPVNIDPAYHYEAINVESQHENPNSLLNWTKRLIALRKQYKAFGRGTLEFLAPTNQRVLAYIRRYQEEIVLVVANLSRFAQAVQLDLAGLVDYTPVEMFGRTDFPTITSEPYTLSLGPNSFFWFALEKHEVAAPVASPVAAAGQTRLPVVFVPSLANIWEDNIRASIASILPKYLQSRRWFRSADRRFRSLQITEVIPIKEQTYQFIFVRAEYSTGDPETYLLPIGLARGTDVESLKAEHAGELIAEIKGPANQSAILFSATDHGDFNTSLLEAIARRKRFAGQHGSLVAQRNRRFRTLWGSSHPDLTPSILPSAEVATAVRFGDHFILKILANIETGVHPGVEMGIAFSELPASAFEHAAPFVGYLQYEEESGEKSVIGLLHGFVPNEGTAWEKTQAQLASFVARMQLARGLTAELQKTAPTRVYALEFALSEPPSLATELIGDFLKFAGRLGQRLAEMHLKLMKVPDPAFVPEPFNDFYRQGLYHGYVGLTGRRLEFLRQRYAAMEPSLRNLAERVLGLQTPILEKFKDIFEKRVASERTRFQGRAHLGHILVTGDDVVLFDFDGDPALHLSERRIKRCPLRDVTAMLMSFAYATQAAAMQLSSDPDARTWVRFWYTHVSAAFVRGYWQVAKDAPYIPKLQDHQQILIDAYMLERCLLDIRPDIQAKPGFAGVPFRVILHLLDAQPEQRPGESPSAS